MDPTDPGGQFVDRGSQYRSAIFYHDEEQKRLAEESKIKLESSGRFNKPIATEIVPISEFFEAEDYHQDYYKKNPLRYKFYRFNSGRDQYLKKVWGDTSKPAAEPLKTQPKPSRKPSSARGPSVPSPRASKPGLSEAQAKAIYKRYLAARKKCNQSNDDISFSKVAKSLGKKLVSANGEVEFKVVIKKGKAAIVSQKK